MNANEMIITARMADHYEREGSKGDYDPLVHAETLFKQFKRSAPKLLRFLLDSNRGDREIGDWIWDFYGRWEKAGPVALKYFAEDELARLGKQKKTPTQLQREIDEALSGSASAGARRSHSTRDTSLETPKTNAELLEALRSAGVRVTDTGAVRYSGPNRSGTLFVTITPSGVIKFRETVHSHAAYTTSKTFERALAKLLEMGAERVFDVRRRW
jgi:hypothetical protein